MQKHEDGSVTFTQEEMEEITQSYVAFCDVLLSRFPTSMSDFFNQAIYRLVVKWYEQFSGREFLDEEEESEEE